MNINVVGVTFDDSIKPFYFAPTNLQLTKGQNVVVETARGLELGKVVFLKDVDESQIVGELKPVIRVATPADIKHEQTNSEEARTLLPKTKEIIKASLPDVKVSFVKYNLDKSKLIITYISDDRVDYRDLVKKLASQFHTRIEMRQIGARDEVAMMGAIGVCGQICCCHRFLSDFDKVSIKMAKEQGLALNPTKINGMCGRLLCCLKYEDAFYHEVVGRMPKINSMVSTPNGEGKVVYNDLLRECCIVSFINGESIERKEFPVDQLTFERRAGKKEDND